MNRVNEYDTGGRFAASGGLFAGGPFAGGPFAGGPFAGGLLASGLNAPTPRRYGSAAGFTCVYLCSTIRVKMHEMKLSVQALRPALAIGTHGALPLVGGASITMLGCHCGKGKLQCK